MLGCWFFLIFFQGIGYICYVWVDTSRFSLLRRIVIDWLMGGWWCRFSALLRMSWIWVGSQSGTTMIFSMFTSWVSWGVVSWRTCIKSWPLCTCPVTMNEPSNLRMKRVADPFTGNESGGFRFVGMTVVAFGCIIVFQLARSVLEKPCRNYLVEISLHLLWQRQIVDLRFFLTWDQLMRVCISG